MEVQDDRRQRNELQNRIEQSVDLLHLPLAFLLRSSINHERHHHRLVWNHRRSADQDRHAVPILVDVLFLIWHQRPPAHFLYGRGVQVAAFRRGKRDPVQPPLLQILVVVSDGSQQSIVAVQDLPSEAISEHDPDHVRLIQAAKLPFTCPQLLLHPLTIADVADVGG